MANFNTVGDLAQTFLIRQQNVQLKTDLQRLSLELSTGQKADIASSLSGDYSPVASIERSLTSLSSFQTANAEAGLFASTMQAALGNLQSLAIEVAPNLLTASDAGQAEFVEPATGEAKQKFIAAVAVLNTQIAGRSVFSGMATDRTALAQPDAILAELQTAIAAETTSAGVITVIDAWFDTLGGGFETNAYNGSANALAPFNVGPFESSKLEIKADDQALRDTLKGLAVASLVYDGALAGDPDEKSALVKSSAEILLSAESGLAGLRAKVGSTEAQIEQASVRNGSEKAALEIARAELLGVDSYETATKLEATRTQLETLYTITARLSRLSLADFLR